MHTDPISDFLTRIRNGAMARHLKVDVPFSTAKKAIADILAKEGYIKNYKINSEDGKSSLRVYLKYDGGDLRKPVIRGMRRESRPGLRVYSSAKLMKKVESGFGISIVTTSKGVITDSEARKLNIGGEVLCSVW